MPDTLAQLAQDTLRLAAFLTVYWLWMVGLVVIARLPAILRLARRVYRCR